MSEYSASASWEGNNNSNTQHLTSGILSPLPVFAGSIYVIVSICVIDHQRFTALITTVALLAGVLLVSLAPAALKSHTHEVLPQ